MQSEPQTHLFWPLLADFINQKHEFFLSQKINWAQIRAESSDFYTRIGAPINLGTGD